MSNCQALQGILKSDYCEANNAGGIYELYINDSDNVLSITTDVSGATSGQTITAISASTDFVRFQFNREVGNFLTNRPIDLVAGSNFYQNTITMVLHRREAKKQKALQILGAGQRFLDIIIKDANGLYWYAEGCQLTAEDGDSGTAFTDGSKYTVTFVGKQVDSPKEVSASIIAGLLA